MNIIYIGLGLFLTGCAWVKPPFDASASSIMPKENTWRTPIVGLTTTISSSTFWQGFADPVLLDMIQQATINNQDLAAAAARVQQARAATDAANASLWPNLSLAGGTEGIWRDGAVPLIRTSTNRWQNTATATLSYEADIFGRLRNAKQAKTLTAVQQDYLAKSLRLSTQAQVATTYFSLLGANTEVENLAAQVALSTQVQAIWAKRVAAGLEPLTALAERQQILANLQQQVATAHSAQSHLADSLAVLVGINPMNFIPPSATILPTTFPSIPAVLPAQVLAQRPDILAAEAALQAAGADVAAAQAAWWPKLNLSLAEAASFDPTRLATTLAANLTASLFDGGTARAEVRRNKAREAELLATYRQTILTASAEANTALSAWAQAQVATEATAAALQAAQIQTVGAKARVKAGLADEALLWNSQQQTLMANQTHIQQHAARLQAVVDLYRALGGIAVTR